MFACPEPSPAADVVIVEAATDQGGGEQPTTRRQPLRSVAYGLWPLLSLVDVLVGRISPPAGSSHPSQLILLAELARIALTAVAAITLLMGPGLLLRRLAARWGQLPLGFLPCVGGAVLAGTGLLAWGLAPETHSQLTCRDVLVPVLVLLLVLSCFVREPLLDPDEHWVLRVTGLVFVLGLARSLWSVSPAGELYQGTIARTLEVGDRPDSRTSFLVSTLVGHGLRDFGPLAHLLFYPYTFSDRGPLSGIMAAPVMLLAGANPPPQFPVQPWMPFDPQGFMAYRILMMLLAVSCILAVYSLARLAGGPATGRIAVLLTAGTPFVVHEVYFTWPKLAAAAMCVLAGYLVIARQPFLAGLFVGIGYLMHPLALLSVPTLLLLVLLVALRQRAAWTRGLLRLSVWAVGAMIGLGCVLVSWREALGSHYTQGRFLDYFRMSNNALHAPLSSWISTRLASVGNTLIPLRLPLVDGNLRTVNLVGPHNTRLPAGGLVHFFFQYWNTLPFGVGITFFPVLLYLLYKLARQRPLALLLLVVLPFGFFAVYWGSFTSGLMREGLHAWLLTLLVLAAIQLMDELTGRRLGRLLTAALVLRLVEIAAMLTVTTVRTGHRLVSRQWLLTDVSALVLMAAALVGLALLTVRELRQYRPAGIGESAGTPAHP